MSTRASTGRSPASRSSEAIEAAFPDRVRARCRSGQLVSVDLRPVNFDSARRDTLRIGFDFSKPLKSQRPSQAVIDQFRAQFGFGGRTAGPAPGGNRAGGPPPEGARRRRPAAAGRRRSAAALAAVAAAASGRRRLLRRRQPRPAALLADRHHHLRRQGDDRARRAGARLPPWRRRWVDRRHAAPPGRGAGRLVQQWPRRAASAPIGAVARGSTHADRRRPPLLAAGDLRPAPVRQSRRHARACAQAPVAARHAGPARGQEHLRQPGPGSTTPSAMCRSTISPTCSTRSAGRSGSPSANCSRRRPSFFRQRASASSSRSRHADALIPHRAEMCLSARQ